MAKNLIKLVLLACALLACAAQAANGKFDDNKILGRWMSFYYLHPDPANLPTALRSISAKGLTRNGSNLAPFAGFIAGAVNKEPALAQRLMQELAGFPTSDQPMIIMGIWYSNHPDAKAMLSRIARAEPVHKENIERLLDAPRANLFRIPLEQGPWVLDALWGYFMATGEEAPVIRIMAALPWVGIQGEAPRLIIGGAARWSLTSNAIQHDIVLAACRKQLALQSDKVQAHLHEIIAAAEKGRQARSAH